jgi:hypothetical protein
MTGKISTAADSFAQLPRARRIRMLMARKRIGSRSKGRGERRPLGQGMTGDGTSSFVHVVSRSPEEDFLKKECNPWAED